MNTVKDALAEKSGTLIHVRSGDMVVEALRQMRDNRVRSVLVIDDDVLVGIVTQGDCAIKVLLPGLDAKQTPVGQAMSSCFARRLQVPRHGNGVLGQRWASKVHGAFHEGNAPTSDDHCDRVGGLSRRPAAIP